MTASALGLDFALLLEVLGALLGLFIYAVVLRTACALYNKLVGGRGSPIAVPHLPLGIALNIVFVSLVVQTAVSFVIRLVAGGGFGAGLDLERMSILSQILSLPASLLVMAGLNTALLPTAFARGYLVALLCFLLMAILFGAILGALVLAGSLFPGVEDEGFLQGFPFYFPSR